MVAHGSRSMVIGLVAAFAAGVGFAVQIFINGRLATHLGSAEMAASVNNIVGLCMLIAVALGTGVPRRALQAVRERRERPRVWQLLVGLNGAFFVVVTAEGAPQVGVALLSVALVVGQVWGALGVDRVGLAPGGRRPVTPARLIAVGLALVAVVLGALGSGGEAKLGLLALAVVAGVGIAVQQAGLGQMTRITGEPIAASTINFIVGAGALVAVALAMTGGRPEGGWSAPPEDWVGGLLGATIAVALSKLVSLFGVLPVALGVVAGQAAGGLLIDVVEPTHGRAVTVQTVLSVVLTVAAVAVAGMAGSRARRAPEPA